MQNTLLDPTALLDDEQRAWLDATMARNRSEFGGWAMEDDDEDEDDNDEGDDSDDDGDEDEDDSDDDTDDWKAKFEAQQRINRQLERRTKKDAAAIKKLQGDKPAGKGGKKDGDEPDAEKIREDAKAEARREAAAERVADKIEAKASKFADPEDAVAVLLRSHKIEDFLDEDGKVDVAEITDALNELGEKKPHLLAQGSRFKGDGDGGRRKGKDTGRPKNLGDAVARHYDGSK